MERLSELLFTGSFYLYLVAALTYGYTLLNRRLAKAEGLSPHWAARLLEVAVGANLAAIGTRWAVTGHAPVSNMYEFLTFVVLMIGLAFVVINRMYNLPGLGVAVAPVAVLMQGYANLFSKEIQPLIPALKSVWLNLHVTMAALGEGFFAISAIAALLYLLRTRQPDEPWYYRWAAEGVILFSVTILAFTVVALSFQATGYSYTFASGEVYHIPPILGPVGSTRGEAGGLLPLLTLPKLMKAKNMNTALYSAALGAVLYGGLRLALKGPVSGRLARLAEGLNPELLDEISYRAVAIGYPIFTLGGLAFAMIWAKYAWTRYWAWDPKETWAFISWLAYSLYLHMRLQRGWEGKPAAVVSVIAFGIILFTLVGVNLLIVGLHSYA